jgi:pimeloyl-ACP methyl ester carboxylesterase
MSTGHGQPKAPVSHQTLQLSEVSMHVAEAGEGPPVILLHGFPELWHSWRHQLYALSEAGYHAIAPDQRGYGGTSAPPAVTDYDITHLTRDVLDLIDGMGVAEATLVGHDFGALVAWSVALTNPDRVTGVAGLSVPYVPRTPMPPMEFFRQLLGQDFYMLWLQQPGVADQIFDADVERAIAGEWVTNRQGWQSTPLQRFPWRNDNDHHLYVQTFQENGFTGPLNWYRNFDRNWELLAPYDANTIDCPSMYIAGQNDPVVQFMPPSLMDGYVTDLRTSQILPNVGHWPLEEAPDDVNGLLIEFLGGVYRTDEATSRLLR